VNLFADRLFIHSGSGEPLPLNKRKQFTPEDVNLRNLILEEIFRISNE